MITDFQELNNIFNAETWLEENFGVEFIQTNSGWLNATCPFDDHVDSNPSFGINLEKGIFKCFGCGREGQFIKLISDILSINFYQAINVISIYSGINLDNIGSLDAKNEKFKKSLLETDETENKNQRILLRTTLKIKNIMKNDFQKADEMYKYMDDLISKSDYKSIEEMFGG